MIPKGTATVIAISIIKNVPRKTGMIPNEPELPAWSFLRAIWGLHSRPKRKSKIETSLKNLIASKKIEEIIAIVIKIEAIADNFRIKLRIFSKCCRA